MLKKIKNQIPLIILILIVVVLVVMVVNLQKDIKKLEKIGMSSERETEILTENDFDFPEIAEEDESFLEELFLKEPLLVLEGKENIKTESFTIKRTGIFSFFITRNELPEPNQKVSFEISLYKEKEREPVYSFTDSVTREELLKYGWNPEIVLGSDPKGVVGGIVGPTFIGPGTFYFQIKVENVDGLVLEVRGE